MEPPEPPPSPGRCPPPPAWIAQPFGAEVMPAGFRNPPSTGHMGLATVNAVCVTYGGRVWLYGGKAMVTAEDAHEGLILGQDHPNQLSSFSPATGEVRTYTLARPGGAQLPRGAACSSRGAAGVLFPSCACFGEADAPGILVYGGIVNQDIQNDVFLVFLPPPGAAEFTVRQLDVQQVVEPPRLFGHSLLFDHVRSRLVCFGGFDGQVDSSRIQTMDVRPGERLAWVEFVATGGGRRSPPGRCFHCAQWADAECTTMWIWGGFGGGPSAPEAGYHQGAWLLDLEAARWRAVPRRLAAQHGWPRPRQAAACCVSPCRYRRQILLHGGYDASQVFDDWWVYDVANRDWAQLDVALSAPARCRPLPAPGADPAADAASAELRALRLKGHLRPLRLKGHQLVVAEGAAWLLGGQDSIMQASHFPDSYPDVVCRLWLTQPASLKFLTASWIVGAQLKYQAESEEPSPGCAPMAPRLPLLSPRVPLSSLGRRPWRGVAAVGSAAGRISAACSGAVFGGTPTASEHTDCYVSAAAAASEEAAAAAAAAATDPGPTAGRLEDCYVSAAAAASEPSAGAAGGPLQDCYVSPTAAASELHAETAAANPLLPKGPAPGGGGPSLQGLFSKAIQALPGGGGPPKP